MIKKYICILLIATVPQTTHGSEKRAKRTAAVISRILTEDLTKKNGNVSKKQTQKKQATKRKAPQENNKINQASNKSNSSNKAQKQKTETFTCPLPGCKQIATNKKDLIHHVNNTCKHFEDKKQKIELYSKIFTIFPCNGKLCHKIFASKKSASKCTHGLKRVACPVPNCIYRYSKSSNFSLLHHLRNQHKKTDVVAACTNNKQGGVFICTNMQCQQIFMTSISAQLCKHGGQNSNSNKTIIRQELFSLSNTTELSGHLSNNMITRTTLTSETNNTNSAPTSVYESSEMNTPIIGQFTQDIPDEDNDLFANNGKVFFLDDPSSTSNNSTSSIT